MEQSSTLRNISGLICLNLENIFFFEIWLYKSCNAIDAFLGKHHSTPQNEGSDCDQETG